VPAATEEEKVVEVEAVEEVGINPAAIEEKKEEVEIIPAAAEEKAIDAEPSNKELAVVKPIVSPSVTVVETEVSVEPEVAKEESRLKTYMYIRSNQLHPTSNRTSSLKPNLYRRRLLSLNQSFNLLLWKSRLHQPPKDLLYLNPPRRKTKPKTLKPARLPNQF